MGSKDDARRTVRVALVVAAALGAMGAIVLALAVWWFATNVRRPSPPPPPAVVNMDEHPGEAWKKFVVEIRESADRNRASLDARPDERLRVRPGASHMTVGGPGTSAEDVNRLVMERAAIDVIEAYFRGDPPGASESPRLREALDRRDMAKMRDRLGPVTAGTPYGSGTLGKWSDTVEGYVDLDVTSKSGLVAEVEADLVYAGDGAWRVEDLAVVPYSPGRSHTEEPAVHDWFQHEFCDECGAIRWTRTRLPPKDEPWHVVPGTKEHEHRWRKGAGKSLLDAVPEGVVVLVSRPPVVAGFILRRARAAEWGKCNYDWAFRDDGGTSLDPSDPAVRSGTATAAKRIDMGGVRVHWSLNMDGKIWLDYPRQAGETVVDEDPRICRTNARSFTDVDPADAHLRFRGSPSDEGSPLPRQSK